jgi:ParB family chromosome partitioning protein
MSDKGKPLQQTVQNIPLDHLQPNPLQPRGSIVAEELSELVESIKRYGVLEPLVIAHTPAGYQIIAGERRWRASKLAGLETVPAIVKETTPAEMLEMAIIENVQRVDLNPMDRAQAFQRLQGDYDLTTTQIAERIGKSLSYVSNSMRLLRLPSALQDGLLGGMISEGHARALASIEDDRLMIEAYKIIMKENGSVRRAEDLARRMKEKSGLVNDLPAPGHKPFIVSKQIDDWAVKLQKAFGDNSKVKLTRSKRETKVIIALKGDPEKTQEKLDLILKLAE